MHQNVMINMFCVSFAVHLSWVVHTCIQFYFKLIFNCEEFKLSCPFKVLKYTVPDVVGIDGSNLPAIPLKLGLSILSPSQLEVLSVVLRRFSCMFTGLGEGLGLGECLFCSKVQVSPLTLYLFYRAALNAAQHNYQFSYICPLTILLALVIK